MTPVPFDHLLELVESRGDGLAAGQITRAEELARALEATPIDGQLVRQLARELGLTAAEIEAVRDPLGLTLALWQAGKRLSR